jgi:hypothetical protein
MRRDSYSCDICGKDCDLFVRVELTRQRSSGLSDWTKRFEICVPCLEKTNLLTLHNCEERS